MLEKGLLAEYNTHDAAQPAQDEEELFQVPPEEVVTEAEFLQIYKDEFDHAVSSASEGYVDDPDDGAWRYMQHWRLYVKTTWNRLERVDELPLTTNDQLYNYVLEGTLVSPNGSSKVRVRLDSLSHVSFDRSKETRAWWVMSKISGAWYRLLEPDMSGLSEHAHLNCRALLSFLSNLLDVCFHSAEETRVRAKMDALTALKPYFELMREKGIDILPFVAQFKSGICRYLSDPHNSLHEQCRFKKTLMNLKLEPLLTSTHDLLEVVRAAELLSNQEPWGLLLPAGDDTGERPTLLQLPNGTRNQPRNVPIKLLNEDEFVSQYHNTFDYPQKKSSEGYEVNGFEAPWRCVEQWSLYKKHGKRLVRIDKLPANDILANYVLEGMLVGPNGSRVRIQLDKLVGVCFDRSKDTRGWWVTTHNGDGETVTAYYRLLEPDLSGLPEHAHLERRAQLALLSNLLDICFPNANETQKRTEMDAGTALGPYCKRMRKKGIEILPIVSRFKCAIRRHLLGAYHSLHNECRFFKTLNGAKNLNLSYPAMKLLDVTVVAEMLSSQKPWGLKFPTRSKEKVRRPMLNRYPVQSYKKPRVLAASSSPTSSLTSSASFLLASSTADDSCGERVSLSPSADSTPHLLSMVAITGSSPTLLSPQEDLMTVDGFKHLLRAVEKREDRTTEVLERSSQIRQGNNSSAQYGRILTEAANKLFDLLGLRRQHVFVDLGSGIGILVQQAAYTRGCESRGVELMPFRHETAQSYKEHAASYIKENTTLWGRKLNPGEITLCCGELQSPEYLDFLTKASCNDHGDGPRREIKAFCNNFNGSMGTRSIQANHGPTVDDYVSGLFASMPPGSMLVTLSPLLNLGKPYDRANAKRRQHRLQEVDSTDASYFTVEEFSLGPANKVATWSLGGSCTKSIRAYRYTRLLQPGRDFAVFLCLNPNCQQARSGTPIPVVKKVDDRPLINICSCKCEPKDLRCRHTVNHRYTDK